MLNFFTDPYPNELLFSALSRYHYYSGNKNYRDTNYELFGKKGYINIYFKSIDNLVERLGGTYNKDDIINNHTLIPAYRILSGDYTRCNNTFLLRKQLFFCPECVKDDIEKYGEPYFHREHQFDYIFICPIHRAVLKPYGRVDTWKDINDYNRFEISNVDLNNKQILDETKYDKLWQISKLIYQLFNCKVKRYINRDVLIFYYNKILKEKGFASSNGIIDKPRLEKEIIDFYDDKILNILSYRYENEKIIDFIRYSQKDCINPGLPMAHLIFIYFLGKNIYEVINDINEDYKPFGEGPWECINAVCSHQDTAVIKNVEVIFNDEFDIPYGIFECEYCGFKYSKYFSRDYDNLLLITRSGKRYHIKEILNYGTLWYETLKNYVLDNKYSVSEICMRMKCCDTTVIDHALKLNIEKYLNRRIMINKKTIEDYKHQFSELKKINPNISRTELSNTHHNKYILLKKYEKEWLDKTIPIPKKRSKKNLDSKTLDIYKMECLEAIKSNPNLSRTDISLILGKGYGIILKHDRSWWEKNAPPSKVEGKLSPEFDKNILEIYKQEFMLLVNKNPEITRTELKLNLRKKYNYILKYDKEWINIIVPRTY